jgi:hypothetical protein
MLILLRVRVFLNRTLYQEARNLVILPIKQTKVIIIEENPNLIVLVIT